MPNPWETVGVDLLLSGIKAANFVNTVSPSFLLEIVNGYFPDLIRWQVREEMRAKYTLLLPDPGAQPAANPQPKPKQVPAPASEGPL